MKTEVYGKKEVTTTTTRPQTGEKSGSPKISADKAEILKKIEAAGTPGAGHKALDAFVGDWKAEVKCWMDPGGPPTVSKATSSASWTLNGRFLEEEFHGEMMGMPFTGRCLLGFDNTKQKFNCVWVDDTHTSMFFSEGKGDSGFTVLTLEGKADCLMTGRKDVPMKQVFRVLSRDKHTLEMFSEEKKMMEITYTRA